VTVNQNLNPSGTPVQEVKIPTRTLKHFIEVHKMPPIGLMKIDVETHEPEVLEGMGEYLAQFKPAMLIEVWNEAVGIKVEEHLKGLGYLYFDIDDEKGLTQATKLTTGSSRNYFICQPELAEKMKLL
jgi:hypothetical protein